MNLLRQIAIQVLVPVCLSSIGYAGPPSAHTHSDTATTTETAGATTPGDQHPPMLGQTAGAECLTEALANGLPNTVGVRRMCDLAVTLGFDREFTQCQKSKPGILNASWYYFRYCFQRSKQKTALPYAQCMNEISTLNIDKFGPNLMKAIYDASPQQCVALRSCLQAKQDLGLQLGPKVTTDCTNEAAIADNRPVPPTTVNENSLETCGYKDTKQAVKIVNETVKFRSASQILGVLDMAYLTCAPSRSIPLTPSQKMRIARGVKQALSEVLGDTAFLDLGSRSSKDVAISAMTSSLKELYADPQLSILNPEKLTTSAEPRPDNPLPESPTDIPITKTTVSGTINLSNKSTCEVRSEVTQFNGAVGCNVVVACINQDLKFRVLEVKKACESF